MATDTDRWRTRAAPTPLLSRSSARCLRYLAEHPGASGVQVRRELGIRHNSQVSRLLERLRTEGLVRRRSNGAANAWELTQPGGRLVRRLRWELYQ